MKVSKDATLNSETGGYEMDSKGSPIGVVRLEPNSSYCGVGKLLQGYINGSDSSAWEKIREKIDYTFEKLDLALAPLDRETGFGGEIRTRIGKGEKILFKPNLVSLFNIDPQTHGPDRGSTACTEWPFVAALMRWFHDRLLIRYREMALGEAATTMSAAAGFFSMLHPNRERITTEAAIEGKNGDFYCGWGFYFVRKYLKEALCTGSDEDPMQGYEESLAGHYIPPGFAAGRLMVYDLNRIADNPSKGRDLDVPDGAFFRTITLHKAIAGGNPQDDSDRKAYPGCILVNVPKLKVHNVTLFTNAIKNLGIGLYPMESSRAGECRWDYSLPQGAPPGIKGGIPHQVWIAEMDGKGFPIRDPNGRYIVKKTGGITAAMLDIIQAVRHQGIFMIHVVDAIETINLDHQGQGIGVKVPEGLIFSGLDPVAVDLFAARYLFSNVPLREAAASGLDDGFGGVFPQRVPLPILENGQIATREGYDSPLCRDRCLRTAEERGIGQGMYRVIGTDAVKGTPLVSVRGRLGRAEKGSFSEIFTGTLYFDIFKFPWDLQKTALQYFAAVDRLSGTRLHEEFLAAFDDDGDGWAGYEESGRKGSSGAALHLAGKSISLQGTDPFGYLKGPFLVKTTLTKCSQESWNLPGHHFAENPSGGAYV